MMSKKKVQNVEIYCPNCGTINFGYLLKNGEHRFRCEKCRVLLVRQHRSRRHNTIELIVPQSKAPKDK